MCGPRSRGGLHGVRLGPAPKSRLPPGQDRDAPLAPEHARAPHPAMRGGFNRRHRRAGHLFQNRYKSIVVQAAQYLLKLTRYLHLNPLRAQVVADLRALERYPWIGHSALGVPRLALLGASQTRPAVTAR